LYKIKDEKSLAELINKALRFCKFYCPPLPPREVLLEPLDELRLELPELLDELLELRTLLLFEELLLDGEVVCVDLLLLDLVDL